MFVDVLFRLLAAAVAGGIIGLQYELRERPGGLGTHTLTAMGATLFCLSAVRASHEVADAVRTVQGVATGVGFIGAAAVLRRGAQVRGIRTAASIWVSAAVGCSIGLGGPALGLVTALFVALVAALTLRIERHWFHHVELDGSEPRPPADPHEDPRARE